MGGLDGVYVGIAALPGNNNIAIRQNSFFNGLTCSCVTVQHQNAATNLVIEDNSMNGFTFGVVLNHEGYDQIDIRYNYFLGNVNGSIVLAEYAGAVGEPYTPNTNVRIHHNVVQINSAASQFGALRVDLVETTGTTRSPTSPAPRRSGGRAASCGSI